MSVDEKAKRFEDICEMIKRRDEKIKEIQALDIAMNLILNAPVKEVAPEVVEDHSL